MKPYVNIFDTKIYYSGYLVLRRVPAKLGLADERTHIVGRMGRY